MQSVKYLVIAIICIAFLLGLIGCGVEIRFYDYEYKMVEPVSSDKLSYNDENIDVDFTIKLDEVSYLIQNKLNEPVTLLYDRAVYVDQVNLAHAVTHSTLSFLTAGRYQPPKVIPPKTELYNYFAPVEKIESIYKWGIFSLIEPSLRTIALFGKGEKEVEVSLSQLDERAKSNVGKRIGVFLPVEVDSKIKDYFFKFEITDVNIYQSKVEGVEGPKAEDVLIAGGILTTAFVIYYLINR